MRYSRSTTILLLLVMIATVAWAANELMSVQVREGHVRKSAGFLSPIVTTLGYGDQVTLTTEGEEWNAVSTAAGKSGFMHASALTEKTIVLNATTADVKAAAEGDNIVLAGKGFNKQVEEEFRAEHADLDYALVDKMETRAVSASEVQAFLSKGQVAGGAQ